MRTYVRTASDDLADILSRNEISKLAGLSVKMNHRQVASRPRSQMEEGGCSRHEHDLIQKGVWRLAASHALSMHERGNALFQGNHSRSPTAITVDDFDESSLSMKGTYSLDLTEHCQGERTTFAPIDVVQTILWLDERRLTCGCT